MIDDSTPLWPWFEGLSQIPRPSKHETEAKNWIRECLATHPVEIEEDGAGNLLLRKPAHPDATNAPGIILQSHLDMVPQKRDDVQHDFTRDPIRLEREGDWLRARGTTLGADNGIGVAAILAVMSDARMRHGPLEALLTVDEEAGMSGASGADTEWFQGRLLLNLDTEEENELYIGCAGGVDVVITSGLPVIPADRAGWKVTVSGLKGGHSGIDIHKPRANAIRLLARALLRLDDALGDLCIESFEGGTLRNAIARSASAAVTFRDNTSPSHILQVLEDTTQALLTDEPDLHWSVESVMPGRLTPADVTRPWLHALLDCPHGVLAWSEHFEGVVHTSANLGVVRWQPGHVQVDCLPRSLDDAARDDAADRIRDIFGRLDAQVCLEKPYPGWVPRPDSPLLTRARQVHEQVMGIAPGIQVIHAGLECGILGQRAAHWDMISFGPTITGAHSPDERVNIPSVRRFWQYLTALLDALAR
ncbi:MAG: aminoacyl-histidine dipeptidase [Gammaproteobacteria bacterium]|nr:MAG: aminoacyl-histidine dipeptidase [Gammaproteobacteria bacterium]